MMSIENTEDHVSEEASLGSDGEKDTAEGRMLRSDLIGSILVFIFGVFVLVSGWFIAFHQVTGTKIWYYSPGFYPMFVGAVLVILAVIMFFKKIRQGARFSVGEKEAKLLAKPFQENNTVRLMLAIALLALYIFVLIGNIPFVIATFLYLAVTMTVFRKDGFALWKIAVISAVTTGVVYLFFGVIAAVPLP